MSRGIGWEFVHVCIDDASRVAFVQVMPDDTKQSAVAFLNAAVTYYESLGVKVARVMTDNGGCYRALAFRQMPAAPSPCSHIRTRPYTPQAPMERPSASSKLPCANGPMPRPISTQIIETLDLPIWMHRYNWHRPHGSLKAQTPISRLGLTEDNLLRLHI